jgi:DNA-binding CsgD family transcriptional regulator
VLAARAMLVASAAAAEQTQHVPVAAWLLHDAARLGAGREVAVRLAALATVTDSPLVAAKAGHALALVDDDAPRLAAAVDQFESIGAMLLAAEAAGAAAEAWRRVHEQRRATALFLRASQLSAQCEGANTPGLVRTPSVVPLTTRERDVAMLAAAGHSSRVIAERLYLSVRTVDNHLGRIYAKLGVSSRDALADVLKSSDP